MPVRKRPISHRAVARSNAVALENGFLGINWTKKQQYANAVEKEALYKTRYLSCKQKQLNKGKTIFPADPRGKCKPEFKRWEKWAQKRAEKAQKLYGKLDQRGQLDPALEQLLVQSQVVTATPEEAAPPVPPAYIPDVPAVTELDTSEIPWLYLGGAAAAGTLILILLLRR